MKNSKIEVHEKEIIEEITYMSEEILQSTIIEPLLKKLDFDNVTNISKNNNDGNNLIAIKNIEFGKTIRYKIIIKKTPIISNEDLHYFNNHELLQIKQDLTMGIKGSKEDPIDHVIFFTPYKISNYIRSSINEDMSNIGGGRFTLVDGTIIAEQIRKYIPEITSQLSSEYQYRVNVEQSVNLIPESSVAFDLLEDLKLDNIYVEMSLCNSDEILSNIAISEVKRANSRIVLTDNKDLKTLKSLLNKWSDNKQSIWEPPRDNKRNIERIRSLMQISRSQRYTDNLEKGRKDRIIEVDFYPSFNKIRNMTIASFKRLYSINKKTLRDTESTKIVKDITQFANEVNNFKKFEHIENNWNIYFESNNTQIDSIIPPLSSSVLKKLRISVLVTGSPGAGKTTLLRRLSQDIVRTKKNELPIILSSIRIDKPTVNGIIKSGTEYIRRHGYLSGENKDHIKKFLTLAKNGKFRIFIDGLDELGTNASKMFESIREFEVQFPKCPLVVSTRTSFRVDWDRAFKIYLSPFNNEQLYEFIKKWFRAESNHREGLLNWLKENPSMMDVSKVPLIAGLLCSLYDAKADMPTTEVDLYEKRIDLLIGKWEKAKK